MMIEQRFAITFLAIAIALASAQCNRGSEESSTKLSDESGGQAESEAPLADEDTYWCPMRGKPCSETDHHGPGVCGECGMPLVKRTEFLARQAAARDGQKTLGVVLYPGFELLDVFGPVEMWSYVKELRVVLVAETKGPVNSFQGIATIADYSFADSPELDIIMVPGGMGTLKEVGNHTMLEFVKQRSEAAEITTSVCSGSWILAAAGVLDGHRATSNKLYFDGALAHGDDVEWVRNARWVDDNNVITSSGVSAGMDMALHLVSRLYGEPRADEIARWTEYRWNKDSENDPFASTDVPPSSSREHR